MVPLGGIVQRDVVRPRHLLNAATAVRTAAVFRPPTRWQQVPGNRRLLCLGIVAEHS